MPSFREVRSRVRIEGFHCHHIIPVSVVERRSLAMIFGKARFAGFDPQDFGSNGMHLPSTERLAAAFNLPLHKGAHRRYNELVAEMISGLSEVDPVDALNGIRLVQNSLKSGMRRNLVRIAGIARTDQVLDHEFCKLDDAVERLFLANRSH